MSEAFCLVDEPRQAEVENLHDVLLIDQQIGRLHVAVDQARLMRMGEALGRLADVVGGGDVIQRAVALDDLLKIAALDVLHDDVMEIAHVVDVVRPDDVAVIERGGGLGLAVEAGEVRRVFARGPSAAP